MANATELRSDIHRLIDNVNDIAILKAVKTFLVKGSENSSDWADILSSALKTELDDSILEADQGKTISHDEAMKQIKNRYHL